MRVPDAFRRCVLFIYAKVDGAMRPAGTAFFAGVTPWEGADPLLGVIGIILTANHVITGIAAVSDDDIVHLRLNTKTGTTWYKTNVSDWEQPDPSVDVAYCTPKSMMSKDLDFFPWILSQDVATHSVIQSEGIGIGDEIVTVGLFRSHLGTERIEPVFRIGNIAAIPVDKIHTEKFGDMNAILVEARSIGGVSGSPVFVNLGQWRYHQGEVKPVLRKEPFLFLGIMHGHWEVPDSKAAIEQALQTELIEETIHTGIGIVIPAQQVVDLAVNSLRENLNPAKVSFFASRQAITSPSNNEGDLSEEQAQLLKLLRKHSGLEINGET